MYIKETDPDPIYLGFISVSLVWLSKFVLKLKLWNLAPFVLFL